MLDFYNTTREKFPDATNKADVKHIERWDVIDPEFAYSWFESLANALNSEMHKKVRSENYVKLFEFISSNYTCGDADVKDCIDVSFVENLFWKVKETEAKPYWEILPINLQELYVKFHGKKPL